MRINNQGRYEFCRWENKNLPNNYPTIQECTPEEFFQLYMEQFRKKLIDGESLAQCQDCYVMEKYSKISGRQKQLLKIGVIPDNFANSLLGSPWINVLKHQEPLPERPVDWQIDLGNFCNAGCVFCKPRSSSKIAAEWKELGLINELPKNSWCNDPALLERFISCLINTPKLTYLHFIGGETLITPAFKKILNALVKSDIASTVTVGFTTNLTVWNDDIIDLLKKFKQVNVGLSIECLHEVNNYVRWPSELNQVIEILNKWVSVSNKQNWLTQIRHTPTLLTIKYLDTLYEYAYNNNVITESCNFISDPAYMSPGVLPKEYRNEIIKKLKTWVNSKDVKTNNLIISTRDPNNAKIGIVHDAKSYINYLENESDKTHLLPELVKFLKLLEKKRNNSILDYIPEYEKLFRSAGY